MFGLMDFETTNYTKDHFKDKPYIRDYTVHAITQVFSAHYMDMTGPKSCPAAPWDSKETSPPNRR